MATVQDAIDAIIKQIENNIKDLERQKQSIKDLEQQKKSLKAYETSLKACKKYLNKHRKLLEELTGSLNNKYNNVNSLQNSPDSASTLIEEKFAAILIQDTLDMVDADIELTMENMIKMMPWIYWICVAATIAGIVTLSLGFPLSLGVPLLVVGVVLGVVVNIPDKETKVSVSPKIEDEEMYLQQREQGNSFFKLTIKKESMPFEVPPQGLEFLFL